MFSSPSIHSITYPRFHYTRTRPENSHHNTRVVMPQSKFSKYSKSGSKGFKGTTHHCPGAKVRRLVKMGPCRGKGQFDHCVTHQTRCEMHGWIHLVIEPCEQCEDDAKRQDAERRMTERNSARQELKRATEYGGSYSVQEIAPRGRGSWDDDRNGHGACNGYYSRNDSRSDDDSYHVQEIAPRGRGRWDDDRYLAQDGFINRGSYR